MCWVIIYIAPYRALGMLFLHSHALALISWHDFKLICTWLKLSISWIYMYIHSLFLSADFFSVHSQSFSSLNLFSLLTSFVLIQDFFVHFLFCFLWNLASLRINRELRLVLIFLTCSSVQTVCMQPYVFTFSSLVSLVPFALPHHRQPFLFSSLYLAWWH